QRRGAEDRSGRPGSDGGRVATGHCPLHPAQRRQDRVHRQRCGERIAEDRDHLPLLPLAGAHMNRYLIMLLAAALTATTALASDGEGVRLKELARVQGVRDNALVGYGLVVGLAGSGDSQRNRETLQSLQSTLAGFGVNVSTGDISSRNVAAVMVT